MQDPIDGQLTPSDIEEHRRTFRTFVRAVFVVAVGVLVVLSLLDHFLA